MSRRRGWRRCSCRTSPRSWPRSIAAARRSSWWSRPSKWLWRCRAACTSWTRAGSSSRARPRSSGGTRRSSNAFWRFERGITMAHRMSRRTLLGAAAASAAVGALPAALGAQAKTVKIGVISPVTGALAEVGQDCRLGAQMAAEAVNAAGGIKSQGGAKLELLLADSQTKPDVARAEADRLISGGAQLLTGGFHSAHVASIAPLAQQRRAPYIIDITAADAITANVAKSVR